MEELEDSEREEPRKVRKEDKSKRGYGHNQEEYEKIRQRVIQSKMASESVVSLTQRFKMIQMMHSDCMDLVDGWKETREKRIKRGQGHDLETTVLLLGATVCVVWFVCRWLFL